MSQVGLARASTMTSQTAKVMVVDDSVVIRGLISRWIESTDGMEVASVQRNGKEAVDNLDASNADVVILDIEMPVMDGLTALPLLLKKKPDLVVIMASTLTQRNAEISMRALELGAKDYIPKPSDNFGISTSANYRRELIEKIKELSAAVKSHKVAVERTSPTSAIAAKAASTSGIKLKPLNKLVPRVLAIGSSTGGPQALMKFLSSLGSSIDYIPVLITQHMPATFTGILAQHIQNATGKQAKEATDGEAIQPGKIYVAPGGYHMLIGGDKQHPKVVLNNDPPVNFCKPAVDPMFDDVARVYGNTALGVVLTGMGSDGANGVASIANAGGNVLAQDEETSVVWGMPRAAAMTGLCAGVLSLDELGRKVSKILGGRFQ